MPVIEVALLDGGAEVKSGYLRKVIHAIQWRMLIIEKSQDVDARQKIKSAFTKFRERRFGDCGAPRCGDEVLRHQFFKAETQTTRSAIESKSLKSNPT